ncbi:DNA primase-helicase subunit [Aeromonas phage 44RR2.8t]|uniref:DnaB-like replicative helicase n=1 Tax=Aeromonas phage 44RR2.8t TaxID=2907963 RepID=Q6U9S0_9CAUD|nr:DNA primase-helicase subunit [Aeromonas phage 44RR2.8t]AAQ81351.1 DNA primase-helicase subunit [Aeromonas phage 44RR2.8t]
MVETILENLLFNNTYFISAYPYLKDEYFDRGPYRELFKLIQKHVNEYNTIPTKTALVIALEKKSVDQLTHDGIKEVLGRLASKPEDHSWLIKETESYCKDQAMYNALSKAIEIQENAAKPFEERNKKLPDVGAIEDLMKNALAISFDGSVGHDWFEDYERRYMLYMSKANKIPFVSHILNKITKGGAEVGTLNVIMAGVNVGKSLGLCSLAADYLQTGKNVVYFSMEMAEHVVAKRIDANLLDVTLDEIDDGQLSFAEYKARMEKLKSRNMGRLIIKQYPTSGANANHFNAFLNELKLKKNFKADIVIVDYLGICASTRLGGGTENSYSFVKAIAEELRGLAVQHQVVLWTGAQTNRGAWDSTDIDMSDVAESAGLPATADFMLAVMETEELAQLGVQLFKQIKSRYGDKNYINKFRMGVRKGNQRWYDLEEEGQSAPKPGAAPARQADHTKGSNNREKLDELAGIMNF